jgi:hypothetical protein
MSNIDWAEYTRQHQEREDAYRATLTPAQLRDYRQHVGETADCPTCGALDVEIEGEEHPDMIGTTYVTTYPCCGHVSSVNDALEYANGKARAGSSPGAPPRTGSTGTCRPRASRATEQIYRKPTGARRFFGPLTRRDTRRTEAVLLPSTGGDLKTPRSADHRRRRLFAFRFRA